MGAGRMRIRSKRKEREELEAVRDTDEAAGAVEISGKFADDTKLGNTIKSEEDQKQLQNAFHNLTA
jgi:hypothetical protein